VDPMTREIMSAEPKRDARGNPVRDMWGNPVQDVHDSWFQVSFKLKWKDAPTLPAAPALNTRGR
jgi:hypothetical protein